MTMLALPLLVAVLFPAERVFWCPALGPQPQPGQRQVSAHLVQAGQWLAVYQEDGYHFSSAGAEDESRQIAAAVTSFDQQIYPRQVALFGPCPDRDDNGKIILLIAGLARGAGEYLPWDELAERDAERFGFHSNQGEVLYESFVEQGNHAPINLFRLSELFSRLLQDARDPADTAWSRLVAAYTPYLCQLAPARLLWGDFDPEGASHTPADSWSERGWPLLFLQYLRDRAGDAALRELVNAREVGLAGVGAALRGAGVRATTADVLADFAMACWLNDPGLAGSRFAFTSVAPPRPLPAVRALASRPVSGALEVGVGGMVYLDFIGNGEEPFRLAMLGDRSARWVARAVELRRHGPDQELPVAFNDVGEARVELPLLGEGDHVVVAAMALPDAWQGFYQRTLLLRWGLAWVPYVPPDQGRLQLVQLSKRSLTDGGAAAATRLLATLERLGGWPQGSGSPAAITTRYAWAPEAQGAVEALEREASARGLQVRRQTFSQRGGNGVTQEWSNLLIEVPGSDPRRWPVVLAAHWDGARSDVQESYLHAVNLDDNASGVAVALEVAAGVKAAPHHAPVIVALLAGGYHQAAGARALLDQLQGRLAIWIELDGVGTPDAFPRTFAVRVEGVTPQLLPDRVAGALRRVGFQPHTQIEFDSPHTGAALVAARGIPAYVVRSRPAADAEAERDFPPAAERMKASPELMALLARAVTEAVIQSAGAP